MIASLVLNKTIKCLPPAPVINGILFDDGTILLAEGEYETSGEWWTIDSPTFCASELLPCNCVFVTTGASTVVRDEPKAAATGEAMARLRDVVSAIREARPLQSSPEFDDLLTRVAAAEHAPDDVEAWARRLAADIADLTD
jgi:hypothetical protein